MRTLPEAPPPARPGSAGNDVFFFAEDGRWGANDHVDGRGGNDIVVLRGDYTLHLDGASMVNVETVTLMSAADSRFYNPSSTLFHYDVTTSDGTVAAGQTMTFNGGGLAAGETLRFDGSAESDGAFRLFGGHADDVLSGGGGNDLIYGGEGADTLDGGGGNDVFRYQAAAESTVDAMDHIGNFALGDVIDLSRIDADPLAGGDQAFSFIGGAAFGGHAGELRVDHAGLSTFVVQADVDGDGAADFQLMVHSADLHALTAADFVL